MPGSQSGRGQGSPKLDDLISLEKAANLSGLTSGHLRLLIRQGDLWGRKIKTLFNKNFAAGNHEVQLNRDQLSGGIFFLRMKLNGQVTTEKLVIQ